ncbi:MAG: putative bifunctional diguanylate cyclase/phosphodiesterase [bacterium]
MTPSRDTTTNKLTQQTALLETTLDSTADGIYIIGRDNQILEYNDQFLNMWNIPENLLENGGQEDLLNHIRGQLKNPPQTIKEVRQITNDRSAEILDTIEFEDGRLYERYSCPVKISDEYYGRLWSFHDITERERARERARELAYSDPLTDLPNRIKFLEYLQGMLLFNKTQEQQAGVLCLDLSRFKRINNSIGQDAGDEVLMECVRRWENAFDDDLMMARTGGDEFMVFVPECESHQHLEDIAETALHALDDPFSINGTEIDVRVNIGISIFPQDSDNVDDLLSMAHRAMVKARENGVNNFEFFLSDMRDAPSDIVSLESDLRKTVDNDELNIHYQPQIDMKDQEVKGFEALLRWDHPERGMISPETTIPLAEETGLILPVGEWVLKEACNKLNQWQDKTDRPLRMAVNVSAEQIIQEKRFLNSLKSTIEESGIDPSMLELEITEHVALRDPEFTSDLLQEFKSMSVRTSVDDFGTGHSTMKYLQKFPYDCMKIDRSFIDGLTKHDQNRVMVDAMISLGNELDLEVIAEGVETSDQLDVLNELNCDAVQGFYYAEPMMSKDVTTYLENQT